MVDRMDSGAGMGERLRWGWKYLMVDPEHFRVEYAINPFMDPGRGPDPRRAREQWQRLHDAILGAGGEVEVLAGRPDSPDMVYAMNLALLLTAAGDAPGPTGTTALASHMRYPERRRETWSARAWARRAGHLVRGVGRDGIGPFFEAGDAFAWRGDLVVGFGPRTEPLALKHLAVEWDLRVHGLEIVHPGMYHLDLAFCPLDQTRAMVCPAAFTEESAARLLDLVPEPLVLTEDEAQTFCANSIVVGSTVLMPACPPRVRRRLAAAGFDVEVIDVGEFLLGGGAIRCLTNPLDLSLGADAEDGGADLVARGAQVITGGSLTG